MDITLQDGSTSGHGEHQRVCNEKWIEAIHQAYDVLGVPLGAPDSDQKEALLQAIESSSRSRKNVLDQLLRILDDTFFKDSEDDEGLEHLLDRKRMSLKYRVQNLECLLEDDGVTTKNTSHASGATMLTDRDNNTIYINMNCLVRSWPSTHDNHYKRILDGFTCRTPIAFFLHTFGHELIHAWINALDEYSDIFREDRMLGSQNEGHGEGFLALNYAVLGGQGSRWQLHKRSSKEKVLETLRERRDHGGHHQFADEVSNVHGKRVRFPEPPVRVPKDTIDASGFDSSSYDGDTDERLSGHTDRIIMKYQIRQTLQGQNEVFVQVLFPGFPS